MSNFAVKPENIANHPEPEPSSNLNQVQPANTKELCPRVHMQSS